MMSSSVWKPHVTVAAIIERHDKYLFVREEVRGKVVINQPAGHLEEGESLIDAVIRETMEETRYEFTPTGLVGIYRSTAEEDSDITYLRFLFCGDLGRHINGALDKDIISAEWLTLEQIKACRTEHRSPLVMQNIEDFLAHTPHSLSVISQLYA